MSKEEAKINYIETVKKIVPKENAEKLYENENNSEKNEIKEDK